MDGTGYLGNKQILFWMDEEIKKKDTKMLNIKHRKFSQS